MERRFLEVLAVLDEDGGFITRDVAAKVCNRFEGLSNGKRIHSAWVRGWLLRLQELGYVATLDNQKPVAWRRTPQGTVLLSSLTPSGE